MPEHKVFIEYCSGWGYDLHYKELTNMIKVRLWNCKYRFNFTLHTQFALVSKGCSSWCANPRPSWSQKVVWNSGERPRNSFQAQDHVFPKLWRSCQYYQDCVRRWWSFNCTEDYRSIYNLMKIIFVLFQDIYIWWTCL